MSHTRIDLLETVERQNAIIRIQSNVIDDLFRLLLQHITAEEADSLPILQKINTAASLRQEIGGEIDGGYDDQGTA